MIEDRHSRRWRTCLPFVLLAAVLLAAFGIGTASALVWETETGISDGDVGMIPSLVLDSAGHPHVGCVETSEDTGDGVVTYAENDGTSWSVEASLGDDVGYPSLALDGAGRPRISYYNVMGFAVEYTAFDGTSWHGEFVSGEDTCQPYSSLALDSAGNPRISYATWGSGADSNTMKYVAYDGSAWQTSTVDPAVGGVSSLALDGSGVPSIAYTGTDSAGNSVLRYAVLEGTTWTIETVDTAPPGGDSWLGYLGQPSLKLDGAGRPRIAYKDSSASDARLKYASYDGTSWTIETVDSAGSVGSSPSLALDAAGYPRISYGDLTNGDLKFAWFDGQAWHIDVVDEDGTVGGWTSLALDSAGNPRIAYHDATNADLKYASAVPTVPNQPPVASLTVDPIRGLAPLPVTFSTAGTGDPDGEIHAWTLSIVALGVYAVGYGNPHSTYTYTLATPGTYTATLTVTDDDGATASDTATISVLTPYEAILDLRIHVTNLGVRAGIQNGLTDKLDIVTAALTQGNEKMAVNNLNAFIKLGKAQKGKALTAAQADALIAEAQRIIATIQL